MEVPGITTLVIMIIIAAAFPLAFGIKLLIQSIQDADILCFFGSLVEFAIASIGLFLILHIT
jgi:hypothetical protein